ncbi:MAG: HPF/RaiA family ribosome-associated protein [Phycisphaerales bacterium]|nr:HPF/RaiA family ribosome-associated protein [Phycisphaerales bacterium]
MKLIVNNRNERLTDSLRTLVERQAGYALGRFELHIREVTVRLSDLNGPKGGIDKRCKVQVGLRSGGTIVAEVDDTEFEPCIHRVMDRVSRRVRRHLEVAQTEARSAAAVRKDETGVGG